MAYYTHRPSLGSSLIDEDIAIVKAPEHEGDDYLFRFRGDKLPVGDDLDLLDFGYLQTKRNAFRTKDINPTHFLPYVESRPSLRSLCELDALDATIYTVACEKANGVNWERCITVVRDMLFDAPSTRRAVLRFANSVEEYAQSVKGPKDVTCLSMIHFLDNHCKLVFRASDVTNELIPDLLTINEFFLAPIYGEKSYDVTVYSSTAQGTVLFEDTIDELSRILNARYGN